MRRLQLFIASLLSVLILLPILPLHAASGNQFDASRIADDSIFFNVGTMNSQDIQNFLNSKVPSCDTNGTQIYSGSTTRAVYSASKGYSPPFTCLKDYRTNVTAQPADA